MTALIDAIEGDVVSASDCLIVANPAAAGVDAEKVRDVSARLGQRARTVRTVWTERPRHGSELLDRHRDAGLVVAVGGDGTVNELVQAIAADPHCQPILCALPAGSGNSTARNLFGDLDWHQVLDLLDCPDACRVRRLDLLRLLEPDLTAVLGVATGFLADVLVRARNVSADVTGIDRYYAAAVGVLQAMPAYPTRVVVDGVVLCDGPTSSVAVGGGRFRARTFQFLPESVLDDGLLDVSTIDALDAAAVAELVPLIPAGTHLGRPDVHYARGRRVVIERTDDHPLVAEFDGSVWDAAGHRLTIDVVPSALRVLGSADVATTDSEGEEQ
jgi:diacylglycerol kinase (ATP)